MAQVHHPLTTLLLFSLFIFISFFLEEESFIFNDTIEDYIDLSVCTYIDLEPTFDYHVYRFGTNVRYHVW